MQNHELGFSSGLPGKADVEIIAPAVDFEDPVADPHAEGMGAPPFGQVTYNARPGSQSETVHPRVDG